MEHSKPSNPLLSLSSFVHQSCLRLGAEISARLSDAARSLRPPLFASVSRQRVSPSHVASALAGTSVYTVSNTKNEFVLISDQAGAKSIGLLCFRKEDAEAFLSQARLRRRELMSAAKVVPITLDQFLVEWSLNEEFANVYMLKVEGIAFRFLPDPIQIRHALELKSTDDRNGFDGVPIFQSELLVVKKKNKRYCPIYFHKEDIERELMKVPKARGSGLSQHIMVGCLEDVLKKIETSEKNTGWEDLVFIPPGKSHSLHIQE